MDKNKQFIQEKYKSDLQQARMQIPSSKVETEEEQSTMDISSRPTAITEEGSEEEYLDDLNQTRADEARTQVIPMPDKPRVPFPWLALIISLANDILDILELTGLGMIATKAIDIIMGIIRFLGKIATPGKTGWGSLAGTWAIEMIPGLGIFPTWTIQCIYNWLQEKKLAEQSYSQAVNLITEDVEE